jgi:signal transduction histidine kinase
VSAQRRILLVSSDSSQSPDLADLEGDASLQLVHAHDARSALEHLQDGGFACALLDLDALGQSAADVLQRVRLLRPELPAVGFGGEASNLPGAQLFDVPTLRGPLTSRLLQEALQPKAAAIPAARGFLDTSHQELQRRVSQLTTLYRIGRAISESRDWTEALDYFLATLCEYLEVKGAGILLYSHEGRVLTPRRVLSIPDADVAACVERLLEAYPTRNPSSEIHALECFAPGVGPSCSGHPERWRFTVLPLVYRRGSLGFLLLDKDAWDAPNFNADLFLLETIQTVLTEEVANAAHLSRLVDLKNFNEAVLERVESGVLTANESGEIHFANRLARRTLGLDPGREAIPALRFEALFPAAEQDLFSRMCSAPDGRLSWEGALLRLDGASVPVHMRTSRIVNPSDSTPLYLMAFEDLSEQKLLEEQLRRADRLRSLGELSAAIAHEVRNPLQGISLTLSNLRNHLQAGGERYVDVMFEEMERLNGLVDNILSFARPAPPQFIDTALAEICRRAIELSRERAAQHLIEIDFRDETAGGVCEVDAGQIQQVVLNMVLNAIDASPAQGRVRVRVRQAAARLLPTSSGQAEPAGASWYRIEVQDQGPGIAPEEREKLFDPFFTTKTEGNGLGLSVSQKIVEEHRGLIHVASEPNAGALFVIELPRGTQDSVVSARD